LACRRKVPCKRKRSGSKFNDVEIDSVLLLKAKNQAERGNLKTAMKGQIICEYIVVGTYFIENQNAGIGYFPQFIAGHINQKRKLH